MKTSIIFSENIISQRLRLRAISHHIKKLENVLQEY